MERPLSKAEMVGEIVVAIVAVAGLLFMLADASGLLPEGNCTHKDALYDYSTRSIVAKCL